MLLSSTIIDILSHETEPSIMLHNIHLIAAMHLQLSSDM